MMIMTQQQIALLVFLIIGGLGLIFLIVGVILALLQKRKIKLCQEMTHGVVVDYCYRGNGVIVPIVEYRVFGETYKKVRTFRGYLMKSWKRNGQPSVQVTKNDYLSISGGRMGQNDAQYMWPMGSNLSVYYNPLKPQMAYVEKVPERQSIVAIIFISLGVFLIVLSILIAYFISL